MRRWIITLGTLSLLLAGSTPVSAQGWNGGVGVVGDSYSDEYEFYPSDRAAARNWVEILAETRGVNFGHFSTSDRGEPRNQGYAYNWARSDATTTTMISQGQHTGVAEQVRRGEVDLVLMFIGGNDFINALKTDDPIRVLPETTRQAMVNLNTAVGTILAARSDVKVVIVTVPDVTSLPEFDEPLREGQMPQACAIAANQAIRRYNANILAWKSRDSRIVVADLYWMMKLADSVSRENTILSGHVVNRRGFGNDVDHVFLNDHRHVGTLGQGVLAQLFLSTVNAHYDANLPALGNNELWTYARSVQPPIGELAHGTIDSMVVRTSGTMMVDSIQTSVESPSVSNP